MTSRFSLRTALSLGITISALWALAACGQADPTPTPTQQATPTPAAEDPASTGFEKEWDDLIAAAQEEGELVAVATRGEEHSSLALLQWFGEKFGINVISTGGTLQENVDRILAEQSADRYEVDVNFMDIARGVQLIRADALQPIPSLLFHPEVVDGSAWYKGQLNFADPEGQYVVQHSAILDSDGVLTVCYNTDLVDETDLAHITSDADWLEPALVDKYKGKVVFKPPPPYGTGSSGYYPLQAHPELGRDVLTGLYDGYDPDFLEENRLLEDGLVSGKYALLFFGSRVCTSIEELSAQGAPVALFDREMTGQTPYLSGGSSESQLIAPKNPPHPNATKLFFNWFLSKEGQTMAMDLMVNEVGEAKPSLRQDIPPGDKVPPEVRLEPGKVYALCIECDPNEIEALQEANEFAARLYEEAVGIR